MKEAKETVLHDTGETGGSFLTYHIFCRILISLFKYNLKVVLKNLIFRSKFNLNLTWTKLKLTDTKFLEWSSTRQKNKWQKCMFSTRMHPAECLSDYLSVHLSVYQCMCSCIVDVNTTSDRLIIDQLEHEIT